MTPETHATPKPGPDTPFEIGLVMAGAISAGTYTAGVIDFLIEALDEWESAKAFAASTRTTRRRGNARCMRSGSRSWRGLRPAA